MKLFIIKRLSVISVICIFYANSSFAGHSYNYGNGCNSGGGSTTSTFCDTWEGEYNYDLYDEDGANVEIGTDASSGEVVVDGVTVKVSAWSDTAGYYDNTVTQQSDGALKAYNNGSDYGWGIQNDDNDWHAIDNWTGNDYDMVLFSFSDAVSLVGATFSWLTSDNNQEVTVVGLNDISGLSGSTWESIAQSSAVVSASSFSIEECDDVYVSEFTSTETAMYWLVGTYNTAFGYVDDFSANNDAFKLASIGFVKDTSTSPKPVDANAPGSFAILMLAGGFVALRNRKRKNK